MFMFGDFTNGLFGGASNVFSLATRYMELKGKIRDRQNADEVERAMQASGNADASTNGLYGTSTAPADTSRPTYDTFDDDPELSKLPKLAKKAAIALKEFGTSPREGKAYGSTAPATPSSAPTDEPPKQAGIGALTASPENVVSGAYSAGKAAGSGLYDWLGSVGQRMRNYSATPQQQQAPQAPPVYLPPEKPPNVGPAGAGGGAGPGTIDTLQQHGALGGAGYPGGPNLAMQQNPLGARIMSAINPGSVT